jgi:hypothetical protein
VPLTTREFTALDTVNIWDLLNEIKGWVDDLGSSGTDARYWTGYPASKNITDGRNVSVGMTTQIEAVGGVLPAFDGDAFRLAAGRYRIDIQVRFDQSSGGYRSVVLMKNPGVTTFNSSNSTPGTYLRSAQYASSSNDTTVQLTWVGTLSATDALMVVSKQTSGATTGIVGTPQDSSLTIQRLGD